MSRAETESSAGLVVACVVLAAFAAGVAWFDFVAIRLLYSQYRSGTFPHTAGRIQKSEVNVLRAVRRSTTSYKVGVSFHYEVNGQGYTSENYRYTSTLSDREDPIKQIVSGLPPGKEVDVYYNPANPADAVLSPGLNPSDFVFVLLAAPFNCFLALLAGVTWRSWRARSHPAGGADFVEAEDRTRVRLHLLTAVEKALGVTGLASLLVAVPLVIFTDPFVPAAPVMAAWALVAVAFVAAYVYFRPHGYLVLDAREGRVFLPSGKKGEDARDIAWAAVTDLRYVEVQRVNPQGQPTGVARTVVLVWSGKRGPKTRTLVTWDSGACARRFQEWLRPRLLEAPWVREKGQRPV